MHYSVSGVRRLSDPGCPFARMDLLLLAASVCMRLLHPNLQSINSHMYKPGRKYGRDRLVFSPSIEDFMHRIPYLLFAPLRFTLTS